MSEIDRYIICVPSHANDFKNIEKVSYGGIVLYTDHLAALAEKERSVHEKYKAELITQNDQLDRYEEQIAALTARIKELTEALEDLIGELEYDISNGKVALEIAQTALRKEKT
jgi:vacuolar-type H+-ATPase subunit I/STV1